MKINTKVNQTMYEEVLNYVYRFCIRNFPGSLFSRSSLFVVVASEVVSLVHENNKKHWWKSWQEKHIES